MVRFRKVLLVGWGAIALLGVHACTAGTELNPQPLPPDDSKRAPEEGIGLGDGTGAGGNPTTPGPASSDAGAEGGDAAGDGDR